tara:strand:+ start:171 stop:386 length:216 start_codon:yes stop_codon:yes gene_type:complete
MSKVKDAEVVEEPKKLVWKEVRENLMTQHKDAVEKIEKYNKEIDILTKQVLKIEGAVEVGDQMNPKEKNEG